jgi:hypothetical protein
MAQLALTVAGGIAGAIVGGPAGAKIGMMIGGAIGGALFGPTVEGPRLSDLAVTASTYGNAIPRLYGTARMSGNMIWTSGIKETKVKKKTGKGGAKATTYTYSASFAIAFCVGPVSQVLRLWGDTKLISGDATITLQPGQKYKDYVKLLNKQKKKASVKYRIYLGDENQLPDSIIVADKGEENTPAYRGLCYVVFDDFPLEDYGNRIPSITAEISNNNTFSFPRVDPGMAQPAGATGVHWVDWEGNRMWREVGPNTYAAIDLYTMDEMFRTSSDLTTGQWCFGRGGSKIFSNIGSANTAPYHVYDGESLTHLRTFARASNFLGISRNPDCQPYNVATQAYTRLGPNASIRVMGPKGFFNVLLHTSSYTGIWAMLMEDGTWMQDGVLYSTDPRLLVLDEADYGSRVMCWDNGGPAGFRGTIWGIPPGVPQTKITAKEGTTACPVSMQYEPDPRNRMYSIAVGAAPGYTRFVCAGIAFDPTNNSIFMVGTHSNTSGGSAPGCVKYSLDDEMQTLAVVWDQSYDFTIALPPLDGCKNSRLNGDTLGWVGQAYTGDARGYLVDMNSGSIRSEKLDDPLLNFGWYLGTPACSWDDLSKSVILANGNNVVRYYFNDAGSGVTVASIVNDLCQMTGLLHQGDIDVSAIEGQSVPGYIISREATAGDCLSQLASAYYFDGVESDYKLKFVTRGGNAVATIDETHLGYVEGRETTIKETRTQEPELPMRVTINYYAKERDYQIGSQYAKRVSNPVPSMFSNNESKTELPLVMTATEAKRIADKGLKMVWANRTSVETLLPWQFLLFDPCDVVKISMPSKGMTYNLRLNKVDLGVDYNIKVDAVTEKAVAYTSVVNADGGKVPIQSAGDPGAVAMFILNSPLLRDTDDTQGVSSISYVGYYEKSSMPAKTVVVVESKNGQDYGDVAFLEGSMDTGLCMNTLGHTPTGESTDEINTLQVRMYNGETLETISQLQMLDGANAAMVGKEVINFREAVLQDDGTYILRGLLRGRRNTQPFISNHSAGERFVLIDPSKLEKIVHGPQDWNSHRWLKAVPIGTMTEAAETQQVDFEPNDLKPQPPTNVKVRYDAPAQEVVVTFSRTSRITAPLVDDTDEVPYREGQNSAATMKYEVWLDEEPKDMEAHDNAIKAGQNVTADHSGSVPIYDASTGGFAALTFRFPYPIDSVRADGKFTLRVWERGYVDGYKKTVGFTADPGIDGTPDGQHWSYTELF